MFADRIVLGNNVNTAVSSFKDHDRDMWFQQHYAKDPQLSQSKKKSNNMLPAEDFQLLLPHHHSDRQCAAFEDNFGIFDIIGALEALSFREK